MKDPKKMADLLDTESKYEIRFDGSFGVMRRRIYDRATGNYCAEFIGEMAQVDAEYFLAYKELAR